MNRSRPSRIRCALALLPLLLAACGGGSGGSSRSPDDTGGTMPPAATPVGTATGPAVTATIGADGGSLTGADGRLTLVVPPGAVDQDTTFSIQPIENHAHGRIGGGYRLRPDDVRFAQPLRLTFGYADDELAGTGPTALGAAFQRADRVWQWAGTPTVDATARTVTVETDHFSDWALVAGLRLRPGRATVATSDSVALKVIHCYAVPEEGLLAPLVGFRCDQGEGAPPPADSSVSEWAVNGVAGGSAATGTVAGGAGSATFTAPATAPDPATVTVSARVPRADGGVTLLLSDITIIQDGDYAGTFSYESRTFSVRPSTIRWFRTQDTPGLAVYAPTGALNLLITEEDCEPLAVTAPIAADGLASLMTVFRAAGGAQANEYRFYLQAEGAVTLQCGGPEPERDRYTIDWNLAERVIMAIGICPDQPLPSYGDEALLAGSYSCPGDEDNGYSATWEFRGSTKK
mgnify:CR=1 FL=1